MDVAAALTTIVIVVEYLLKFIAIGTVPENRRPASSSASEGVKQFETRLVTRSV